MEAHKAEVERIALRVQEFYNTKEKFRIYHGSSSSTRRPVEASTNTVDTSRLNHILRVDASEEIAVVEANVPMDAFLEETLKHDLMPLVVTEFPGITVGGAYSGTAGESSSFKHWFFDRTVSEMEIVLANGEVINCSEKENAEVFKGAPGALGTLGVVTLLTVRLQKAAHYVEVTYYAVEDAREAVDKFQAFATQEDEGIQYLDGMMFSPTKGAIVTGRFHDSNPQGLRVQRFSRAKDPWYFMHVEERIASSDSGKPWRELIPLPDYIFRYNRGCFWCGKSIFDVTGFKLNKTTRRLFDPLLRTRMLYKALHTQEPTTLMVIQDVAVPFPAAEKFIEWSTSRLDMFPLWLCPLRVSPMPTLHPHPLKANDPDDKTSELMLNIGVYGSSSSIKTFEDWIYANQELEDKVTELGGMKWAYAAQLYAEGRFWEQYDREWYDNLRDRCHAAAMPNIYDKTRVDLVAGRKMVTESNAAWETSLFGPLGEIRCAVLCVWEAVKSRAWRLERHSAWKKWPEQ
ncbi:hypothetical protein LTR37_002824 [Vermiconidia calcicola]|uniref:Uncharacterized protein n=1 Tax=Vermiconidia calcicola TaxID=1690605 RepID=A0ACC3NRX9_9PEZI|nr:hypothetical protein LTR37_002824 [Vermiconidia calcicola]